MNNLETCPICQRSYTDKNIRVEYHLRYNPTEKIIHACQACNYAEYLTRHWKRHLKPWQWWRIKRVREFNKENGYLFEK